MKNILTTYKLVAGTLLTILVSSADILAQEPNPVVNIGSSTSLNADATNNIYFGNIGWESTSLESEEGILEMHPQSYTGAISVPQGSFVSTDLTPLYCSMVEVTQIGVEIDASSSAGTVIIGLYENSVLIHETSAISVAGGTDEFAGEVVPPGLLMQPGATYGIGVITSGSINLKTSTAPQNVGILTFADPYTHFNNNAAYPFLPNPYEAPGSWGFNTAFNIQGIVTELQFTGSLTESVCSSYTSPSGNHVWSSSGTYYDTVTTMQGCDSLITINLTVTNNATTGVDVVSACNSYTWIDGNTYTSNNNSATHALTNVFGCDSIVTLNLSISNTTYATQNITACESFTWVDGVTYTSSTNTPSFTYVNSQGCDYIVSLNLTILQSTSSTDVVSSVGSYTWIDGNTYSQSNNTATYTTTNAAGCDSVVSLNLTVINLPGGHHSPGMGMSSSNKTASGDRDLKSGNAIVVETYPNPTEGELNISIDQPLTENIRIIDMHGRTLYSGILDRGKARVDLKDVSPGTYLLVFEESNQIVRIVKK